MIQNSAHHKEDREDVFEYDGIKYTYKEGKIFDQNMQPVSQGKYLYLWYKKTKGRMPYQAGTRDRQFKIWENLKKGSTMDYVDFLNEFERPAEKDRFINRRLIPLIEEFLDQRPPQQPGDIYDEWSELLEKLKPLEKIRGFTDFSDKLEGFRFPNPERLGEAYDFLTKNKIFEGDKIDFIAIHQGRFAEKRIKYLLTNGNQPHKQSFVAYLKIMFGKKRDAHLKDAYRLFVDAWDRPLDIVHRSGTSESIVLRDKKTGEALLEIIKPRPK